MRFCSRTMGALTWGRDVIEALYRMEGLEHYATMVMYTQHIIGKSNVLSCDQISELVEVRNRLGIKTGGVPPCALNATNTQDVVRSAEALEKEDLEDIINRVTNEVLAKMGI